MAQDNIRVGDGSASMVGRVAGLGAMLIWLLGPLIIKVGIAEVEPAFYVFLRFVISTVVVLPFCLSGLVKGNIIRFIKSRPLLFLAFAFTNATNLCVQSYALRGIPYSWYIVLFSLHPILALLMISPGRLIPRVAFGMAIAVLGSGFFVYSDGLTNSRDLVLSWPFFLLFLGMVLWSVYSAIVAKVKGNLCAKEIAFLTVLTGGLGGLVASLFACVFSGASLEQLFAIDSGVLLQIVCLAAISPAAYWLFALGMQYASSFTLTVQYLDPVLGCVIGALFLHEKTHAWQWIGTILVLGGVYLVESPVLPRRRCKTRKQCQNVS